MIESKPEAEDDVRREILYYDGVQDGLGDTFLDDLLHAYSVIERQPQSFHRVQPALAGREIRAYIMDRFPYSVIYEIIAARIVVLAIIHHKRGPGYWRRRVSP